MAGGALYAEPVAHGARFERLQVHADYFFGCFLPGTGFFFGFTQPPREP